MVKWAIINSKFSSSTKAVEIPKKTLIVHSNSAFQLMATLIQLTVAPIYLPASTRLHINCPPRQEPLQVMHHNRITWSRPAWLTINSLCSKSIESMGVVVVGQEETEDCLQQIRQMVGQTVSLLRIIIANSWPYHRMWPTITIITITIIIVRILWQTDNDRGRIIPI